MARIPDPCLKEMLWWKRATQARITLRDIGCIVVGIRATPTTDIGRLLVRI